MERGLMVLNPTLKRILLGTGLVLMLLFVFQEQWPASPNQRANHQAQHGTKSRNELLKDVQQWQEESGIRKIVALVPYGRRQQASILDCYLKRNLAANGGVLDEVIWLQQTSNPADLAFLDRLIRSDAQYSRVKVERTANGYASAYDDIKDDVLYITVDTDIVFIEDTTILSMVHTRATRPESYLVGANIVNQPRLGSWLHGDLGAVRPYLPENTTFYPRDDEKEPRLPINWRASLLPEWSSPSAFDIAGWSPPEGRKHRWLPIRNRADQHILDGTPIRTTTTSNAADSPEEWSWAVGAQQHYSFFEHLENDQLWRYRFEASDYRDHRIGLQFVAMTGKDINLAKPIAKDEERHLCSEMPKRLGRTAVAAGGGVAVYYSFASQKDGMANTDVLDRYRSYAQERICRGTMLWTSELDDLHA